MESDDGLVGEFRQVQDEGVVISHEARMKTRQQPLTEIAAPPESAIELVICPNSGRTVRASGSTAGADAGMSSELTVELRVASTVGSATVF